MFSATSEQYLFWQEKLKSNVLFRRWWQFWSNYSSIIFIAAFIVCLKQEFFVNLVVTSFVAAIIARFIFTPLINLVYKKQRPYQLLSFEPITSRFLSFKSKSFHSFPSRHIAFLAAITGVFFIIIPVLGWILLLATVMTGMGRVVLGYHYPMDVLGGLVVGLLTSVLVFQLWNLLIFT